MLIPFAYGKNLNKPIRFERGLGVACALIYPHYFAMYKWW